ncbi:hypothetical protein F5B20DRAFT_359949 [Whalleya microplaca]|nr:hypothetical protein F5B20DRAFT_359949 [Whalleya microplaca]
MSCSCRTAPMRAFVQSLVEVRISDSAVQSTRRTLPGYFGSDAYALRRASPKVFAAPFSAATASRSPRRRTPVVLGPPMRLQDIPTPEGFDHVTLDQVVEAEMTGKPLNVVPGSIDLLISRLDEAALLDQAKKSKKGKRGKAKKLNNAKPPTKTAKSIFDVSTDLPTESSKLKKRKIIKDEIRKDEKSDKEQRPPPPPKENWRIQKEALKAKFPEGWNPRKRISPEAMEGIRALHAQYPAEYTTGDLARKFEVSPEAIRRILKGKWKPTPEEDIRRQQRWFNRGKNIWTQMAELGKKPPQKWRKEGVVRDPSWNEKRGPKDYYPYVPRTHEQRQGKDQFGGRHEREEPFGGQHEQQEKGPDEKQDKERDQESTQRKLSGNLL